MGVVGVGSLHGCNGKGDLQWAIAGQLVVRLTQWDVLKNTDRFGLDRASFVGERLIVIEAEGNQVGEC